MKYRTEIIGDCTLYQGDCLEVLPTLPEIDAVVTSPPYNCGKDYGEAGDRRGRAEFQRLLSGSLFETGARVAVVNVGQYIGSRSERVLFRDVLEQASGARPFDEVIWDKGPANGAAWGNYPNSPRIRAQHESIYAYGNPKMPTGNGLDWAEWSRLTTSIWRVSANVDLKKHPAMMPTEVARRCVSLWSDVDGVVVDPFMGSGTTGVACIKAGRQFIGVELDPSYFDLACRKIEDAYRQPVFDMPSPQVAPRQQRLIPDETDRPLP